MIKLNLADLKTAINAASQVISDKATHAILQYSKIECEQDKLIISSTDLKIAFKMVIAAEGNSEPFCIHTKKLNELIAKINPCVINLQNETGKTKIWSDDKHVKTKINLSTLPVTDFPELPVSKTENMFSVNGGDLLKGLKTVQYAASTEQTRYFLNGVYFELKDKKLNLVATDGRRLSKTDIAVNTQIEAGIIVPVKALNILAKVVKPDMELKVIIDEKQVFFFCDNISIVSNIIDGTFPNYHQVIPAFTDYSVIEINVSELMAKVERVIPLVEKLTNKMIFDFKDNELLIKAANENGDIMDTMDIQYSGELVIGLNYQYVIDILKVATGDKMRLLVKQSNNAVSFQNMDDNSFIGLIMPMKVENA